MGSGISLEEFSIIEDPFTNQHPTLQASQPTGWNQHCLRWQTILPSHQVTEELRFQSLKRCIIYISNVYFLLLDTSKDKFSSGTKNTSDYILWFVKGSDFTHSLSLQLQPIPFFPRQPGGLSAFGARSHQQHPAGERLLWTHPAEGAGPQSTPVDSVSPRMRMQWCSVFGIYI